MPPARYRYIVPVVEAGRSSEAVASLRARHQTKLSVFASLLRLTSSCIRNRNCMVTHAELDASGHPERGRPAPRCQTAGSRRARGEPPSLRTEPRLNELNSDQTDHDPLAHRNSLRTTNIGRSWRVVQRPPPLWCSIHRIELTEKCATNGPVLGQSHGQPPVEGSATSWGELAGSTPVE